MQEPGYAQVAGAGNSGEVSSGSQEGGGQADFSRAVGGDAASAVSAFRPWPADASSDSGQHAKVVPYLHFFSGIVCLTCMRSENEMCCAILWTPFDGSSRCSNGFEVLWGR